MQQSSRGPASSTLMLSQWVPPLEGHFKCNVDVACFDSDNCLGYGAVIRDHNGVFIAATFAFVAWIDRQANRVAHNLARVSLHFESSVPKDVKYGGEDDKGFIISTRRERANFNVVAISLEHGNTKESGSILVNHGLTKEDYNSTCVGALGKENGQHKGNGEEEEGRRCSKKLGGFENVSKKARDDFEQLMMDGLIGFLKKRYVGIGIGYLKKTYVGIGTNVGIKVIEGGILIAYTIENHKFQLLQT
ncbi:hypothetical protein GH714_000023 [Hevea brasiliensis]|uniref:RNase H type-1 domain-containing protein n=1 Tax=Hevea brasiliensis TaxID=3981 RepID=A0A6A6LBW3_HEVBR|nr:hypothetical protein GH714_000023 [Hevea brasiliensis]